MERSQVRLGCNEDKEECERKGKKRGRNMLRSGKERRQWRKG